MKRVVWLTVIGVGAAGLLAVPSAARADEGASSTGSSSASRSSEASAPNTLPTYPDAVYKNDLVLKMDDSRHEITLANAGKTMPVSNDCMVMKNGKVASMSDVKEGDAVRAATSGKGDSAKIVGIWVLEPGKASTSTGSSGQ